MVSLFCSTPNKKEEKSTTELMDILLTQTAVDRDDNSENKKADNDNDNDNDQEKSNVFVRVGKHKRFNTSDFILDG